MEELHGALCSYFRNLLAGNIAEMVKRDVRSTDPETGAVTETSEWVETGLAVRPSAGELAVIAKFLKDNAITGVAAEGSELSELDKALQRKHATRGRLPTEKDVAEAMKELGSDMLQ